MTTTYEVVEHVIPLFRSEGSLSESGVQSMYVLYVDGQERSGAAHLHSLQALAEIVYGVTEPLTVVATVFDGF